MKNLLRKLDSPPRALVALALVFGLPLIFLFPPFQAPDEHHHFLRVWQISQGQLRHTDAEELPRSVIALVQRYERLKFRPDQKTSSADRWSDFSEPLEPDLKQSAPWPASNYIATAYIGQLVGVVVGRIVHAPVAVIVILARLFGLLTALAILWLALARSVAFSRVMFLTVLLPMAISQLIAVSCDGQLIAWSFLLFAEITRAIFDDDARIDRRFLITVGLSTILVAAIKPMYIAPLALMLALPPHKTGGRKRLFAIFGGITFVGALFALGTTLPEQAAVGPFEFLYLMIHNFSYKTFWYLETFIGQPGWLDVHLPPPALLVYFFALTLVCLTDRPAARLTAWTRLLGGAAWFAATVAISYSMYRAYTPRGAQLIEGIQGRYFLPLVPTAAVALATRKLRVEASSQASWHALYAFCAIGLAVLTYSVTDRYYGL